MAAQVLTDVPLSPGGHVPFSVTVPGELLPDDNYGLRVHVDVSGSGVMESGDLVSAEANPVPAGSGRARSGRGSRRPQVRSRTRPAPGGRYGLWVN
ncbi:hypothetical protein SANTM175S_10984 [Streptomyces antimycoticus]